MLSLASFALGILGQVYSMFSEAEPFIQQLAFMCVAMPSAIAIINHYYYHYRGEERTPRGRRGAVVNHYFHPNDADEERTASVATHARDRELIRIPDADTSQRLPSSVPP